MQLRIQASPWAGEGTPALVQGEGAGTPPRTEAPGLRPGAPRPYNPPATQ